MNVSVKLQWNKKTYSCLKEMPSDVLYLMAKQTLDLAQPMIPMSNTKNHSGTLRRSSLVGGVRQDANGWYIGSFTMYASSVWKMSGVNWTTPGTNNQWYVRTLKEHQELLTRNAIDKAWRKMQ